MDNDVDIIHPIFFHYTMKKNGVLQLALHFNFWVAMIICNSSYFYNMNVFKQVAWVATHCTYGAIHCNYVETIHFQLLCNSTTTIAMVTLVIFIHPLKLNMWHYEIFWLIFFKISSIMIVDGSILWHVA
jgi:hypothetical protein